MPVGHHFQPRIWQFDYLGYRAARASVDRLLDRYVPDSGPKLKILDVGCGHAPWKHVLAPRASDYVGLDVTDGPNVDVVASAEAMPFPDHSFDLAFSMAVYEHIPDVTAAIAEAHRVLRPGGLCLMGIPYIWPIHGEPYDFWRWTQHGVAQAFRAFGELEVDQPGNAISNFLLVQNVFLRELQERALRLRALWTPWILFNNLVGKAVLDRPGETRMATFYVVAARKAVSGP